MRPSTATVHTFPAARTRITQCAPRRRTRTTLSEIAGFLRAVREAREAYPSIPREAWVAAGRVEVRSLRRVDAETVRAYALDALRAGRGAA